ncbi:multidrug effflux MFS transporter [Flaviaesturariibacter amylovorans]|uniref:Multidrug effflux MFS transporter n=1 Tax=Flaviaesturariibacter amylovorans TaxID=1084520 RepID=A0ABP8HKC0_9BACT
MKAPSSTLTIVLLGLLTAIVPFSIDMYLPGFTDIARTYETSVARVSLTLSSFFIGIGIGQLVYGPLLDRFGRLRPLYIGLLVYCAASVGCAVAPSLDTLIALRFLQAAGACSASIAATAMVRDLFPPQDNAKIFSYLILVLSVSPMLAPTIGSVLSAALGWRSIFIVLAGLIVLIALGVRLFLRGSKGPDVHYSLRPASILRTYRSVLREPVFLLYAVLSAIGLAGLFTYIASSPGVFMEHFGLSQQQYGILFAFLASGLIIAAQVNTVLLRRFRSAVIIRWAFGAQVLLAAIYVLLAAGQRDGLEVSIGLLFFYLAAAGLIMPNATALAMRPFSTHAGSASALLGFVQMGLGSVVTVVIGLLAIRSALPMAACMLGGSVIGLLLLLLGTRAQRQKKSASLTVQEALVAEDQM